MSMLHDKSGNTTRTSTVNSYQPSFTTITVFEIVDSHLPGYVYLRKRYLGLLIQCTDDSKYRYTEYHQEV